MHADFSNIHFFILFGLKLQFYVFTDQLASPVVKL